MENNSAEHPTHRDTITSSPANLEATAVQLDQILLKLVSYQSLLNTQDKIEQYAHDICQQYIKEVTQFQTSLTHEAINKFLTAEAMSLYTDKILTIKHRKFFDKIYADVQNVKTAFSVEENFTETPIEKPIINQIEDLITELTAQKEKSEESYALLLSLPETDETNLMAVKFTYAQTKFDEYLKKLNVLLNSLTYESLTEFYTSLTEYDENNGSLTEEDYVSFKKLYDNIKQILETLTPAATNDVLNSSLADKINFLRNNLIAIKDAMVSVLKLDKTSTCQRLEIYIGDLKKNDKTALERLQKDPICKLYPHLTPLIKTMLDAGNNFNDLEENLQGIKNYLESAQALSETYEKILNDIDRYVIDLGKGKIAILSQILNNQYLKDGFPQVIDFIRDLLQELSSQETKNLTLARKIKLLRTNLHEFAYELKDLNDKLANIYKDLGNEVAKINANKKSLCANDWKIIKKIAAQLETDNSTLEILKFQRENLNELILSIAKFSLENLPSAQSASTIKISSANNIYNNTLSLKENLANLIITLQTYTATVIAGIKDKNDPIIAEIKKWEKERITNIKTITGDYLTPDNSEILNKLIRELKIYKENSGKNIGDPLVTFITNICDFNPNEENKKSNDTIPYSQNPAGYFGKRTRDPTTTKNAKQEEDTEKDEASLNKKSRSNSSPPPSP